MVPAPPQVFSRLFLFAPHFVQTSHAATKFPSRVAALRRMDYGWLKLCRLVRIGASLRLTIAGRLYVISLWVVAAVESNGAKWPGDNGDRATIAFVAFVRN